MLLQKEPTITGYPPLHRGLKDEKCFLFALCLVSRLCQAISGDGICRRLEAVSPQTKCSYEATSIVCGVTRDKARSMSPLLASWYYYLTTSPDKF